MVERGITAGIACHESNNIRKSNYMKTPIRYMAAIATAALLSFTACAPLGSPPNTTERALFQTVTNHVEVIETVIKTNEVTVLNIVHQTNEVGAIVTVTNHVVETQYALVTITNLVPSYVHTVSDSTRESVSTLGSVINTFFPNIGTTAVYGVLGLLGIWAQYRSARSGRTSQTLSQEMQTVLSFIESLPNGAMYKKAVTTWLQSHQIEQEAIGDVLNLIKTYVDKPLATQSVDEIMKALNALSSVRGPAPVAPLPVTSP